MCNFQEDRILGMLDNQKHRALNAAVRRNFTVEYKKHRGDKITRLRLAIQKLSEEKLKKERELLKLINS